MHSYASACMNSTYGMWTNDRVPNVGVRGCFPGRRKQEAVIA